MTKPVCISETDVHNYCCGVLNDSARISIESHLGACESCRHAIESYEQDESLFIGLKTLFRKDSIAPAPITIANSPDHFPGYEIQGEIHRGGQGVVYEAVQLATNRIVALKVLLHGQHASQREQLRFDREVNLAAALQHPNIVTVYESGCVQEMQYCAMQYVDGLALLDRIGLDRATNAKPEFPAILRLFETICHAVGYAHRCGVIHRDLKPSNILVSEDNQPHILDFGLAKQTLDTMEQHVLTASGEFCGTLAYVSPEQASGKSHIVDARTDVYSIGIMLFEAITQSRPYPATGSLSEIIAHITDSDPLSPSSLCAAVDDELETILLKALSKDPDRRYQSAELLAQDLRNYMEDLPIEAKRDSTWYLMSKSVRRHRYAFATTAGVLIVIVSALITSLTFWARAVKDRDLATSAVKDVRRAEKSEQQQRIHAEFQSYVANMAAAQLSVKAHDAEDAQERLARAPVSLRNWEWHELWARCNASTMTLEGHTSYVEEVIFQPDGTLISISWDNTVRLWNRDGSLRHSITGPDHGWSLAGTPNGSHFAASFLNGQIGLWKSSDPKPLFWIQTPGTRVFDMVFHPTMPLLAFAYGSPDGSNRGVRVVNYQSNDIVFLDELSHASCRAVSFSPDGRFLALGKKQNIVLCRLDEFAVTGTIPTENVVGGLAFSPDGTSIAVPDKDTVVVYDVKTGKKTRTLRGHLSTVHFVIYSKDGSLISTARDKTIRIWPPGSKSKHRVLLGHKWAVTSVAVSHDGTSLASGSWDQSVRLWDLKTLMRDGPISAHPEQITGIAFDRMGQRLFTSSYDGHVKIWNADSAELLHDIQASQDKVQNLTVSPDDKFMATASWNGTISLWDLESKKLITRINAHSDRVHSLVFSLDSSHLISGSRDNQIHIWNRHTGNRVRTLTGHDDHIHCVALDVTGTILASSGHRSIRFWDWEQGIELLRFDRNILKEDYSLAFHPDGLHIATGIDSQKLAIFSTTNSQARPVRCRGHSDEILSAAYHPDGSRLASSSLDGSTKIWETSSYEEVASLDTDGVIVNTLTFSPDGNKLAAGLRNGTLRIWRTKQDSTATASKKILLAQ